MYSINFSSSSFYAAIHWKISKIHIYKGMKKAHESEVWMEKLKQNFYMERHAAWKKCGTRDYILIFFIQFSIFWEHQHQIWEEKKSEALEKIQKNEKKNSKLPHFYRFLFVSGAMAFSTHSLFTLYSHPFTFFFPFSLSLQSLPSYTHFLLYYSFFCCVYKINSKAWTTRSAFERDDEEVKEKWKYFTEYYCYG